MKPFAVGLEDSQAVRQAKTFGKYRAQMLRDADRAELVRLRGKLQRARARRARALKNARKLCRRARVAVRVAVADLRAREHARINAEVAAMRGVARNRCQARQYRIHQAGGNAATRSAAALREARRLQLQITRLGARAKAQKARYSTARERRQEDDDAVRSNLPPELVPVFERVKRQIKAGPRTTRTEAFLEWAQANPGDVLTYQDHDTDREVRRLVAEHERLGAKLAKGSKAYAPSSDDVKRLARMGLAPTEKAARRQAGAGDDWVPF